MMVLLLPFRATFSGCRGYRIPYPTRKTVRVRRYSPACRPRGETGASNPGDKRDSPALRTRVAYCADTMSEVRERGDDGTLAESIRSDYLFRA